MKVYVAGRTTDIVRVRRVQDMVTTAGGTITFDWTRNEREGGEGKIRRDWSSHQEEARALAQREVQACLDADVVINMWSHGQLGAHFETAFGMMSPGQVWIVGELERDSIFFYLPNVLRVAHESMLPKMLYQTKKLVDRR